jgi:hypothetical protein
MGIVIMFSVKLMIASARNMYGDSTPILCIFYRFQVLICMQSSILCLLGKTYAGLAQEALGPRIGKALVDICTGSYILGALIGCTRKILFLPSPNVI